VSFLSHFVLLQKLLKSATFVLTFFSLIVFYLLH